MFRVEKTLQKTVVKEFQTFREVHQWAADNRYTKNREVKIFFLGQELEVAKDRKANIWDLYNWSLNKFSENNYSWEGLYHA